MKKPIKILSFISSMLMVIGLTACSQDEICMPDNGHQAQALNPFSRSIDEAIDIAESSMAMLYPETGSRATARKVSKENVMVIKASSSRSDDEDKLIYAVNFDDNQGYVLVAAPRSKDDVLAVVPKGAFDEAAAESTPGVDMFLSAAKRYITLPDSLEARPIIGWWLRPARRDTLLYFHQDPQVSVEWGDDGHAGALWPNNHCGCGALAIATLATHQGFQRGDNRVIHYTYPNRDIDYQLIDWAEVYRHKREAGTVNGAYKAEICYAENKIESHKTIGRLCRQIGVDGFATVRSSTLTSMSPTYLAQTLRQYVPSVQTVTEPIQFDNFQISPYLDKGLLVLYGMRSDGVGHIWVADGYDILKVYEVYVKEFEGGELGFADRTIHRVLTHMRWGLAGNYDGYFDGKVFSPDNLTPKYEDVHFIASYK